MQNSARSMSTESTEKAFGLVALGLQLRLKLWTTDCPEARASRRRRCSVLDIGIGRLRTMGVVRLAMSPSPIVRLVTSEDGMENGDGYVLQYMYETQKSPSAT